METDKRFNHVFQVSQVNKPLTVSWLSSTVCHIKESNLKKTSGALSYLNGVQSNNNAVTKQLGHEAAHSLTLERKL